MAGSYPIPRRDWLPTVEKPNHRPRRLLRAPPLTTRCCAAEQRDELAAPDDSITSSARASKVAGMSRPSALAVLRLMTSSTFVDCCTRRSAAFAPLRILPAAAEIAFLRNPTNPYFGALETRELQAAAAVLGVRMLLLNASNPHEIEVAKVRYCCRSNTARAQYVWRRLMSRKVGHSTPLHAMSGLPPQADLRTSSPLVSEVPRPDIS